MTLMTAFLPMLACGLSKTMIDPDSVAMRHAAVRWRMG